VGLALACAAAAGAEPPATLTLLEGQAALLRGTSRHALAEGVRLQAGDIIEIGDKGVAQFEFGDGFILSLGAGARFYAGALTPRGSTGADASDLYLMRGWSKFASRKGVGPFRLTTPAFGIWTSDATGVVHIAEGESSVFVETGEVRVTEGFAKASRSSPLQVKGGAYLARKPAEDATIHPRPSAAFIAAMPRPYMDNLPPRIAKYKDRDVAPQRVQDLTYADVEMWLKGPSEIRRPIMQRFVPGAKDPVFRQALIENLKFHPEWDPILFPEKYRPKPRPKPAAEPPPSQPVQAMPAPTQPTPVQTPAPSTPASPPPAAEPAMSAPLPPSAAPGPALSTPASSPPAPPPPAASAPEQPSPAPPPAAAAPAPPERGVAAEPEEPVTVEDAGPGRTPRQ
jgi:hypothetical protein